MQFMAGDRVEVSILSAMYPKRRWVRRATVTRAYPKLLVVRYDDTSVGEFTEPTDFVRKLSLLELIAESAQGD